MKFWRSVNTDKPERKKSVIILLVLAVVMLIFLASGFITDWMWFSEVGYVSVFLKGIFTEFIIGIPIFIVLFLITDIYLRRIRQRYFDMVRSDMQPDRKKLSVITNLAAAGFSGLASYITATDRKSVV